MEAAGYK